MIAMDVLSDALFAAVAGMGFGAISCPPKRAFPYIALLAAVGHAARFCLMTFPGVDLATGSLAAALLIGFGSLWLGRRCRTPMTVLCIPALLPMIPGMYAYRAVDALLLCLYHQEESAFSHYLYLLCSNGMTCCFIILGMVVGATVPIFLFKNISFQATR